MAILLQENGLETHGLRTTETIHWNLPAPTLYEHATRQRRSTRRQRRGVSRQHRTLYGSFTSRQVYRTRAILGGKNLVGQQCDTTEETFEALRQKMFAHLASPSSYVRDMFAGADPRSRLPCTASSMNMRGTISL